MITYYQIVTRFRWFADAHPMVGSFSEGELEVKDWGKDTAYPILHVQPTGTVFGERTLTYSFQVTVAMLHRDSGDSTAWIRNNLSDSLQIVSDLLADVRNGFQAFQEEDFQLQLPASPTPFIEEDNDTTTGWQVNFDIQVGWDANACISPLLDIDAVPALCDPVPITLNDTLWSTASPGSSVLIPVQYANGTEVGSKVGNIWVIPNPGSGDPAEVTVNGSDPIEVDGGDTLALDVHNSEDEDVGTLDGSTLDVGDASVLVNGEAFDTVKAEGSIDVEVVDGNDNPAGEISGGKVVVDLDQSVSAALTKTGQTTSYVSDDDGDLESGRGDSFFLLESGKVNPFGNQARFTGTTGGYTTDYVNGLSWMDKDGVATTEALAFPNDIFLDWLTYDVDAGTVLGYTRLPVAAEPWADLVASCSGYSVGSFSSGWRLTNIRELFNILNYEFNNVGSWYPWRVVSAAAFTNTFVSNTQPTSSTNSFRILPDGRMLGYSKSNGASGYACRDFSVSGTTIS